MAVELAVGADQARIGGRGLAAEVDQSAFGAEPASGYAALAFRPAIGDGLCRIGFRRFCIHEVSRQLLSVSRWSRAFSGRRTWPRSSAW